MKSLETLDTVYIYIYILQVFSKRLIANFSNLFRIPKIKET